MLVLPTLDVFIDFYLLLAYFDRSAIKRHIEYSI